MKYIIIASLFAISLWNIVQAQVIYNPLHDQSVRFSEATFKSKSPEYIWYPGQLSAHLQQKRLAESQARCVNVGYPGNFYKPVPVSFFSKEVNLSVPTIISWVTTGIAELSVNGQQIETTGNRFTLPEGKSKLEFKVTANHNLPTIRVLFDETVSVNEWKASLDGITWNFAETSPLFGTGGKMPLDDPEVLAEIKPASVLPVRNAIIQNQSFAIGKNGYVLADFHHLEVGKVSFKAKGQGKLTVFVGETPEEAMNDNTKFFEQQPIDPFILSANETLITLPERAVRYTKILCTDWCEISELKFTAKIWPVEQLMNFECNDERYNRIWDASVASLLTSTHGFYLDGIKRDYLPWSMDAVISTFAGDYLFGDKQVSLNSLSVALLPLNPQKSDLGIPDYPLHALVGFHQHFKRYGDFKTILAYRDRIEQLLAFYQTIQDERGFISANVGVSWGFVPGWSTRRGPDRKGTPTYAQIMLYHNYIIGANFAAKWGDRKSSLHYRKKAEALKNSIWEHFWDDEQGLFINGYTQSGELDKTVSHHAQYWAILAGIFPENCYRSLFQMLSQLAYYRDYVSYEKGYEFMAYSKAGQVEAMWNFLHEVFGDWLAQGHTRFPENFSYKKTKDEQLVFYNRPYGLSICHGANGVPGVVAVLNGIAGFSQSDAEMNHYTIRPNLLNLEWANIQFPVKEGVIRLKLKKEEKTKVEIPAGCRVDFIGFDNKLTSLTIQGLYEL